LASAEVNDAVLLLVATTAVTAGFAAVAVDHQCGSSVRQRLLRRRLGDVAEVRLSSGSGNRVMWACMNGLP
jgi:hypothetical protein